ncbi:hypothetical protein IFM89_010681 [Coptis chinensis]|uniref:Cytochrome b561 domain-containing protein n=1 Tax=Coptis chinensis TaxID=261450 RepID=A0A835HDS9_9MAGN|nr:hypothetical protein IFM89_010681 [Coptis chinensis]
MLLLVLLAPLLTIQTTLPTLFEGNPGLRNVHGILGSGIITLFLIRAALWYQIISYMILI